MWYSHEIDNTKYKYIKSKMSLQVADNLSLTRLVHCPKSLYILYAAFM